MQMSNDQEIVSVDEPLGTILLLGNVIMSRIQNRVVLAKQGRQNGTPEEVANTAASIAS